MPSARGRTSRCPHRASRPSRNPREQLGFQAKVAPVNRVALPLMPSVGLSVATTGAAALGATGVVGASSVGLPTCLFLAATGVACPFCGLTHGVAELGAGNLATAVALHPLAPLAAVLALAVPYALLRGRRLAVGVVTLWALVALILLTWIARVAV